MRQSQKPIIYGDFKKKRRRRNIWGFKQFGSTRGTEGRGEIVNQPLLDYKHLKHGKRKVLVGKGLAIDTTIEIEVDEDWEALVSFL